MDAEKLESERLRAAITASGQTVYAWHLASGDIAWLAGPRRLSDALDLTALEHADAYLARTAPNTVERLGDAHAAAARTGATFSCIYALDDDSGQPVWVEDRGRIERDPRSGAVTAVGALRPIGREGCPDGPGGGADFDALTGQYNRRRLREALAHALRYGQRHGTPGLFVKIGIDNLALTEGTYGRDVAERMIVAVSRELDRALRASDVLGRIGRAEFGAVLIGRGNQDLAAATERFLLAAQRASIVTDAGHLPVTASVGAVAFPGAEGGAPTTEADLLANADLALEKARRTGTNSFSLHDGSEAQLRGLRTDMAMAEQIQTALHENGFEIHYQPVVDARTREPAFFECLVRMKDQTGAILDAGAFVPIAEKIGLIRSIDRAVLELVLDELATDETVSLALNISGLSTTDPSWLRRLTARLDGRTDLAERLLIEITETTALLDLGDVTRFLRAAQRLGCRVALDDFGAGYTSFRHLQELSVDVVKIDGSFVSTLAARTDSRLFVEALQSFGDGLGFATVAECVETDGTAEQATTLGVRYLQGSLFGIPRPTRGPIARAPTRCATPPCATGRRLESLTA